MLKIFTIAILFLTTASFAYGFQTSEWINFSPEGGKFSVLMPNQPTSEIKESESNPHDSATGQALDKKVRYTSKLFLSKSSGEVYLVGWVEYEPGFKFNVDGEIKASRDNFIKGISGELVSEKKITLEGNPGLEFMAKKENGLYFKSRVIIIGERPYILVAVSSDPANPDAEKFFSSFKLTKKQ